MNVSFSQQYIFGRPDLVMAEYQPHVARLKRSGSQLMGCCPFHEDSTPSFAVNPDTGEYFCHGCRAQGDLPAFTARIRGIEVAEAMEDIHSRYGLGRNGSGPAAATARVPEPSAPAKDAEGFWKGLASEDEEGIAYLTGRNLWPLPDEIVRFAPGEEHRIAVPLYDAANRVVNVQRRPAASRAKTKSNSPAFLPIKGAQLAGTSFGILDRDGDVWLVEGLTDYLAASALAKRMIPLGIPGATNGVRLVEARAAQLKGRTVAVSFDNDAAGEKAAAETASVLRLAGANPFLARYPAGYKDLAEVVEKLGVDGTRKVMAEVFAEAQALSDEAPRDTAAATPKNGQGVTTKRQSLPAQVRQPACTPELATISATEILSKDYPAPRWAVPGLIPEGLSILAGRPKIGKSWLALNAAVARATGGPFLGKFPVEKAPVIYGAFEDSERRVQLRLRALGITSAPSGLDFLFSMPRLDQGGLDALRAWLTRNRGCGLAILDVYNRIRGQRPKNADPYQHDAEQAALLQAAATELAVPLLVLTHDRKATSDDWLDQISGTLGTTGTADAVMLLTRERGASNGRLQVTGRDLDEKDLCLEFQNGLWQHIGPGETIELTVDRRKILDALPSDGEGVSPTQIKLATGISPETIKKALPVLKLAGLVGSKSYGKYVRVDPLYTPSPLSPL